jgi:hypothetical protein
LKLRHFAGAAALLIATAAPVCADEQVWTVDQWPADVGQIPCSAWSRNPDGTWVLSGALKLGSQTINNIGVKGDSAAHLLDRLCGKSKK